MTMAQNWAKSNAKMHGTVYTPAPTVFRMLLLPELRDDLKNLDKPFLDPCVGQGQFPAAELVLKMFYNIENLDGRAALRALYFLKGIDIQAGSVAECKVHMLAAICEAFKFFTGKELAAHEIVFAMALIDRNFIVGDSLNNFAECAARLGIKMDVAGQQTLF